MAGPRRVTARSFVLYCVAFAAAAASRADGIVYEKIPFGAIFEQGTDEVQTAFKLAVFLHNQNNTERRFELQAYVDVIKTADAYKLSKLNAGKIIKADSQMSFDPAEYRAAPKRPKRITTAAAAAIRTGGRRERPAARVTRSDKGGEACAGKSTGDSAAEPVSVTRVRDQTTADKCLTLPCRIFTAGTKIRPKTRPTKCTAAPSPAAPWICKVPGDGQTRRCPPRNYRGERVTLSTCVPVSVRDPASRWFLKMTTTNRDRMTELPFK